MMNVTSLIKKHRLVTVLRYLALLTFMCGAFTLMLISITLRPYNRLTVGTVDDQFLIPGDLELEAMSDNQLLDVFTKYTNSFQILCRNHKRVGLHPDGDKEVCVDDAIRPKTPCLVYSFGSDNQFDFEDRIIKFFGCDVLTFHPTMGEIDRDNLKIPDGCRFFQQGLDGINVEEKKSFTMDTILRQFNHSERTLDLLKMDIDGSEWPALDQMMTSGVLKNVRQLLVDFHLEDLTKYEKIGHLGVFRNLYDYGFRAFTRERDPGRAKVNEEIWDMEWCPL